MGNFETQRVGNEKTRRLPVDGGSRNASAETNRVTTRTHAKEKREEESTVIDTHAMMPMPSSTSEEAT